MDDIINHPNFAGDFSTKLRSIPDLEVGSMPTFHRDVVFRQRCHGIVADPCGFPETRFENTCWIDQGERFLEGPNCEPSSLITLAALVYGLFEGPQS